MNDQQAAKIAEAIRSLPIKSQARIMIEIDKITSSRAAAEFVRKGGLYA